MKTDISEIASTLKDLLKMQIPPLKIRHDKHTNFEVAGTKEVMHGKQKVDGFFFACVVPKEKDVRLYFFPIYTHVNEYALSPELKKSLKGKSCFHFKKLTPETEAELNNMIERGVKLYIQDNLI